MLIGALLIVCGIALCLWNELRPGFASSRDAEAGTTYVSGVLQPVGMVEDPAFGVSTRSLALRRTIDIFRDEVGTRLPGPTVAPAKVDAAEEPDPSSQGSWVVSASGSRPDDRGDGDSAAMAFVGETWRSASATLEGLQVDAEIVAAVDGWQPLAIDERDVAPNLAATFVLVGGRLLSSADPAAPQEGDLRISWSHLPAQHVSVVAHRSEQRLEPLDTALWGRPFVLAAGPVNVAAMPAVDRVSERSGRMSATWPVRVLVFGTFWLGLYLLLWPLRSFVKPLPLLGRLTSGALWLGSLLTAAVLTSVTVLLVRLLAQL